MRVIHSDPGRKPENVKEEKSIRQKLLEEFEQADETLITLAYFYAKGYCLGGEDVTKAWVNSVRNMQALEAAYIKGYQDAEHDIPKGLRRDLTRRNEQ